MAEIENKYGTIRSGYDRKADFLHKILEEKGSKYRYLNIKTSPENIDQIIDKFANESVGERGDWEDLADFLLSNRIVNRKHIFKTGDLIGITANNKGKGEIPDILFYVDTNNGLSGLDVEIRSGNGTAVTEYPAKLIIDIHKRGYKVKDIKKLYDLPFDTSS